MNGKTSRVFHPGVTHLVTTEVGSAKYNVYNCQYEGGEGINLILRTNVFFFSSRLQLTSNYQLCCQHGLLTHGTCRLQGNKTFKLSADDTKKALILLFVICKLHARIGRTFFATSLSDIYKVRDLCNWIQCRRKKQNQETGRIRRFA